jgi:hypothetical protein
MVKMIDEGKKLEEKAKEALIGCLNQVTPMKADIIMEAISIDDLSPDFVLMATWQGESQTIIVEVKSAGYPSMVRSGANAIKRCLEKMPGAYGVIIAPYISSRAASMLEEEGIGYVDFAGNCKLDFKTVYIKAEGKTNPSPEKRVLKSLFAPKASRIIRILLTEPQKPWKMEELAKVADVSLGLVGKVKNVLFEQEMAEKTKNGFKLTKAEGLLLEWSSNYSYRKNGSIDYYSMKELSVLERELAEFCSKEGIRYGLTLLSGAARVAPYARYNRVFAYVEERQDDVARGLDLKQTASGPNMTLMIPFDQGVLYRSKEFDGISVVSPIQLYLDLAGYKGRGEEAAEFLLDKEIKNSW